MGFNQSYDDGKTLYWYLTDEEFLELGKDAQRWIYPSQTFGEVYNEKKDLLDQFQAVKTMEVYDTQGQGAFNWYVCSFLWRERNLMYCLSPVHNSHVNVPSCCYTARHEQRMGEYDVVALDFCTLVGTNNPNTIHRRRWFRNYFIEPIGSEGSCDASEIDQPYEPQEAQCTPIGSELESNLKDDEGDSAVEEAEEDKTVEDKETENVSSNAARNGVCAALVVASLITGTL